MRLNPDCVRDILLTIEKTVTFHDCLEYQINDHKFERLNDYTHDEIIYHIRQCEMSNLIFGVHYYDGGENTLIQDLSPKGHEFLENIRSDNMWNHTKSVAETVGSFSLNALTTIATGVLTQVINHQLGVS